MKEIELTKGFKAIVDDEDYERVSKYKWYAKKTDDRVHAQRTERYGERKLNKKHHINLHEFIIGKKEGFVIDHINCNPLDNRRCNLRHATIAENSRNHNGQPKQRKYSIYKGVKKNTNCKTYCARITFNGVEIYLGSFDNEIEAAKAYNVKALELFGEFAKFNEV